MDHNAASLLTGERVYVSSVEPHPEAAPCGVTGEVVAVDAVGVLLRVERLTGGYGNEAGQRRFVPWSAVQYVVLDPR